MFLTDYETFSNYVQEGVDLIPEEFQKEFDNLQFVVDEYPTPYQRKKIMLRKHHLLFGLYEGIPLMRRNHAYSGVLPDKITIFKKPIEIYSDSEEQLRRIVHNTVWHEVAHHFGMNEEEVRAAEKRRGHVY